MTTQNLGRKATGTLVRRPTGTLAFNCDTGTTTYCVSCCSVTAYGLGTSVTQSWNPAISNGPVILATVTGAPDPPGGISFYNLQNGVTTPICCNVLLSRWVGATTFGTVTSMYQSMIWRQYPGVSGVDLIRWRGARTNSMTKVSNNVQASFQPSTGDTGTSAWQVSTGTTVNATMSPTSFTSITDFADSAAAIPTWQITLSNGAVITFEVDDCGFWPKMKDVYSYATPPQTTVVQYNLTGTSGYCIGP